MGKEAANDCSGLSVSEKKIPESSDYVDKIDDFVRETQPPNLRFSRGDGYDYEVWCRRDDNFTSTGGANTHINKQLFDVFSFESPAMAAGIRFPFTFAQWKELERQAAIYKYMVSCLPVPPELLYPLIRNLVSPSMEDDFTSPSSCMRLRNGDLEPGRCKRTDGKKWRCSREVAPHQKYCERHLHRGRPRSRKQVEVKTTQSDCKKMRVNHKTCSPASSSSSPQDFLTGNNHHLPLCDPRDPINREMESIMVDHHHLNQGYATLFNQQQYLDTLFFPKFPAPEIEAGPHQGGYGKEEEEGRKESRWMRPLSWELLIGGGPLAEALQLGSPRESINAAAAAATTVSSPSRVLQRTLFLHTDGSVCNSPTLCPETAFHWLN